MAARTTEYAAALEALSAAAAAFDRAKKLGLVTFDDESGRLFAAEVGMPNPPKNPEQLRLDGC